MKIELINPEMVLIPERKFKDFGKKFGKKIRDWTKWEGDERYDIYYSPTSVDVDYPSPDVNFLLFDKLRKEVVILGDQINIVSRGRLNGLEETMNKWYMDKLVEETECMENFKDYLIKKYREKNLN